MSQDSKFSMGGQALLEGVMMNGPSHYAATVRRTDGSLVSTVEEHHSLSERNAFWALPVVRGAVRFVESLSLGMKALDFSADAAMDEAEAGKELSKKEQAAVIFAYALGTLMAVALFVVLPVLISRWLLKPFIQAAWLLTICEGIVRLLLFFGYMLLVSRIPEIGRTFEYHGAEHKTVACYEAGLALTVENARIQSRLNKRCGTSFIFIVMIISIILFMFIPVENPLLRILFKLMLLPITAGVSYELLKLSARSESKFINALVAPGLWFQKISTREPDDAEIEVALNSAILILKAENLPLPEGTAEFPFEWFQKVGKS